MEHVRIEVHDRIAVVTLDRPPVNSLDEQTFLEIAEAFDGLSRGRDATVAVLTAAGDRAFCAGVDLRDSPRRHRPDGRREDGGPKVDARFQVDAGRVVRDSFDAVYECGVPVIAAVGGPAIGAGLALVACCDLIVASTEATFALTEISVGVLGGVRHAQRMVGPYFAKRMFLTGEAATAEEVYARGAIESVVAPDQLLPAAMALATTIASKSPIAVRLIKESANRVEDLPLQIGYRTEQDYTTRIRRFADSDEARVAYLEKRSPDFRWE
jgi:enoyl-CoA hydratase